MNNYNWNENLDWEEKFKIFKDFISTEKKMPERKNKGFEAALYNWVRAQKDKRTKDRTRIEKIISFSNELNIKLSKRTRTDWLLSYNELESYLLKHNQMPNTGEKINGIDLRAWINFQLSLNQPDPIKKSKVEELLLSFNIKRDIVNLWEIYFKHLEKFLHYKIPTRYSKDEKFKEWIRDLKRRWHLASANSIGKLTNEKVSKLKSINFENLIINDMIDYENLSHFVKNEINLEKIEIFKKDVDDNIDDELNSDISDIDNKYDDLINFDSFYDDFKKEYFNLERVIKVVKREQNKRRSGLIIEPAKLEILSLFDKYNLSLNVSQKMIKETIVTTLGISFLYNDYFDTIKMLFQKAIDNVYLKSKNKGVLPLIELFTKNQSEVASKMDISRERVRQLFNIVLDEFVETIKDSRNLFIIPSNKNLIEIELKNIIDNKKEVLFMQNTILYGPTGTGKSHIIENNNLKKTYRCMFHEEYSYFDFIGQYKPVMYTIDKNLKNTLYDELNNAISIDREPIIAYSFIAGDFIKAYVEAYNNPEDQVLLIIEEINRGNSSSIFGDVFQLLDRDNNGFSKYPVITSKELSKYLKDKNISNYFELKIPNNLSIFATMNTSDQSLFFMDSAFKRRWNLKYIPINYEEENLINVKIENTDYYWLDFIKKLNSLIAEKLESENKCIGQWFIKPVNNFIKEDDFRNKLLHYLFFDVFHHDRLAIFKTVEFSKIYNKNVQDFLNEIF